MASLPYAAWSEGHELRVAAAAAQPCVQCAVQDGHGSVHKQALDCMVIL